MRLAFLIASVLCLAAGVALIIHVHEGDVLLSHTRVNLQYEGPLYVGGGEWERTYQKDFQISNVNSRKTTSQSSIRSDTALEAEPVQIIRHKHQSKKHSRKTAVVSTSKNQPKGLSSPSLDVGELPSEISEGLSTIFRLHDNPVTMRSPVKILDHV